MTVFDIPIYIKQPDESSDVMVFGKSPKQSIDDLKNGISRFGGVWRTPSYFNAYLKSAAVLIEHGVRTNSLDDIGLPAFYLQRHATELLIKRLLSWLYEIAEFYIELGQDCQGVPSDKQKKDLKSKHNLPLLLENLSQVSRHFEFDEPPVALNELVKKITNFEETETWARYEKSETKKGGLLHHTKDETALPLVELQQSIELVVSKTMYQHSGGHTYEEKLYDKWYSMARTLGKAG